MNKDIWQIKQTSRNDLKGEIRRRWGKLTDDDLSQMNDGMDDLITLLRKRYGYGRAQAEIEINRWLQETYLNQKNPNP